MKKKLTLEHLSAYLPYRLKFKTFGEIYTMHELHLHHNGDVDVNGINIKHIKPIFRPISDLTNEIEHNEEKFIPVYKLEELCKCGNDREWIEHFYKYYPQKVEWDQAPYWMIKKLFEWNFEI